LVCTPIFFKVNLRLLKEMITLDVERTNECLQVTVIQAAFLGQQKTDFGQKTNAVMAYQTNATQRNCVTDNTSLLQKDRLG